MLPTLPILHATGATAPYPNTNCPFRVRSRGSSQCVPTYTLGSQTPDLGGMRTARFVQSRSANVVHGTHSSHHLVTPPTLLGAHLPMPTIT
eukprot:4475678-Amphidinium_carterae.1